MTLSKELLKVIVCPVSKGPLVYNEETQELMSYDSGLAYPLKHGIPMLLASHARKIDRLTMLRNKPSVIASKESAKDRDGDNNTASNADSNDINAA